jgi:hypothetical protein
VQALWALRAVKLLHTLVWAFFVVCIVAIPVFAWRGKFGWALLAGGAVSIEIVILLLNQWSCPLTAVAARYTEERRANFDIYLPEPVARHNKLIFGTILVVGVLFALFEWLR